MRNLGRTLAVLCALALGLAATAEAKPVRVSGEGIGRIDNLSGLSRAQLRAQAEVVARGLVGARQGELRAEASQTDALNTTHVRMQQYFNGRRVYGAELILHARDNGNVYLVNGHFLSSKGVARRAKLSADEALARALRELGISDFNVLSAPELTYVLGQKNGVMRLAWRVLVQHETEKFAEDYIFADALTGAAAAIHPTVHYAKSWSTYDAENGKPQSGKLPGTLLCTGNQTCGDPVAQDAHDYASVTYDYYMAKFGRDSLDDNGYHLDSSVHVDRDWNNATWYRGQMMYGDGDGVKFSPLSGDLDVVAHELTHGVTDFTSDLVYQDEPGALNEAMSDIFGANTEAWYEGGINGNTWKIGEDVTTPGVAGDALRYMDNPTLDGQSRDYYPERYTGTGDNGGVHLNSGIGNLAYYLLVEGGSHPRNKTAVSVTGIGMDKAEQIFYRAQTTYFTKSTDFAAAADDTAQAALDLYTAAERDEVVAAWCAVGVGSNCGGGNFAPTASFTADCPSLTCDFTDTSSDSDGSVVAWSWDFGDGNSSTAQNPSHTYGADGTYTVSLTVTDNEGATNSTSQSLNVSSGGGDNIPPVISNVSSSTGKGGNFTVTWTTDEPATSVLRIPASDFTNSDTALVTSHSLTQRGSKGATFIYYVDSTDAAGNTATSGPHTHQN